MKSAAPKRPGRRDLVGTSWSATQPADREKHFRVVGVRRPRAHDETTEIVELEALLTRRRREVPVDELADETRWRPGWRR